LNVLSGADLSVCIRRRAPARDARESYAIETRNGLGNAWREATQHRTSLDNCVRSINVKVRHARIFGGFPFLVAIGTIRGS